MKTRRSKRGDKLVINRVWQMPNKNTFEIEPIRELINKHNVGGITIDPFANKSKIADITNDLDPKFDTDYNLDALEFLQLMKDKSINRVLYDPPFSPRQVAECYKRLGKTVNKETTQSSYWSRHKKEISRIVVPGGKVITCGWNSGGIGKKYGFEIIEILIVAHGAWHNDTIVTVEQKVS